MTDTHRLLDLKFIRLPNKKWFLWYVTLEPLSNNPKIHSIIVPELREVRERENKILKRYKMYEG